MMIHQNELDLTSIGYLGRSNYMVIPSEENNLQTGV